MYVKYVHRVCGYIYEMFYNGWKSTVVLPGTFTVP